MARAVVKRPLKTFEEVMKSAFEQVDKLEIKEKKEDAEATAKIGDLQVNYHFVSHVPGVYYTNKTIPVWLRLLHYLILFESKGPTRRKFMGTEHLSDLLDCSPHTIVYSFKVLEDEGYIKRFTKSKGYQRGKTRLVHLQRKKIRRIFGTYDFNVNGVSIRDKKAILYRVIDVVQSRSKKARENNKEAWKEIYEFAVKQCKFIPRLNVIIEKDKMCLDGGLTPRTKELHGTNKAAIDAFYREITAPDDRNFGNYVYEDEAGNKFNAFTGELIKGSVKNG